MSLETRHEAEQTLEQKVPAQLPGNIRQSFLIALLAAGAGFALITSATPSAPPVEAPKARASLEDLKVPKAEIAFTVPHDLKPQAAALHANVTLVSVKAEPFAIDLAAHIPEPDLRAGPLPEELQPVPDDKIAPPAPLPPKIKGPYPRGLHPVLKHAMVEASRFLPEGWQLEFMSALRDNPRVWNGPHGKRDKTGGALAVDVWLVDPKGQRLCNFKCPQHFEAYQTFMQMVKHIQDRDFPAYRNQGRWGGYFGGRYANDQMHYDLEPSSHTAAGNWEKGLYPQYAYFGRKGDVSKGMGHIASYKLPATGSVLASLAAPAPAAAPVAVAVAGVKAPPVVQKVAEQKPAAKRAVPPKRVAAQWRMRPQRKRIRQRYEDEDDDYSARQAEYRERMRYARASRYGGRYGSRSMRDVDDE